MHKYDFFQTKFAKFRTRTAGGARLVIASLLSVAFIAQALPAIAKTTTIGVLLESRPNNQPWSAAFVDGAEKLKRLDKDVKVTMSYKAFDPTSAEPVARQFIAVPVDILVMHSFALNDVAHKLAKENPQTIVSVSSFDPPVQPNLNIGTASYMQIGYSQCWMLAKLTKSGKIGYVAAMPVPYATELLKACELGAAAARPGVIVLSAYSNSFIDQQATREQARALVDRGADALFPASATEDSLGGFQLCEQQKIPCAGWASDIRRYAPNYGVSAAVIDWSVDLQSLLAQSHSGKLTAATFDSTFGNHGLISQPADGPSAQLVPANVRKEYDAMIQDLASGKISLPKSAAHPCCE